jgi:hypothetical protein
MVWVTSRFTASLRRGTRHIGSVLRRVIINSEEESKVLLSIFAPVAAKLKVIWVFIGFHDLYNEGQYLTVFGKESLSKCIEHMEYIMC